MSRYMRLHSTYLAISMGITWGGAVFLMSLAQWLTSGQADYTSPLLSIYIGQIDTLHECALAALVAFVDAAISSFTIAYIYNVLLQRWNTST